MQSPANQFFKAFIVLAIIYFAAASMEESSRNMMMSNPYERSLESELIAKLLMLPQRLCHSKRNSELINSLLGLPKNMQNAGK